MPRKPVSKKVKAKDKPDNVIRLVEKTENAAYSTVRDSINEVLSYMNEREANDPDNIPNACLVLLLDKSDGQFRVVFFSIRDEDERMYGGGRDS